MVNVSHEWAAWRVYPFLKNQILIMYRQLTIIQKITFKGWIKHPETRPKSKHFDSSVHKYMDGLHMIWILEGFESAVNQFFINTP